jgi:Zn finger protein HypA/HybF involved in hydrogenase expression
MGDIATISNFARTLDQELAALLRGASLECLACGEFVMKRDGACFCPECGSLAGDRIAVETGLQSRVQAG